jgi:gas vesicle protein
MAAATGEHAGNTGTLVCSFLCGALTGAALATLLAPARGSATRERLVARAREGRTQATQVLERGREALDRTRSLVSDEARHAARLMAEGREALADIRDRGGEALGHMREEAAGAVTDAKAAFKDVRRKVKGSKDE